MEAALEMRRMFKAERTLKNRMTFKNQRMSIPGTQRRRKQKGLVRSVFVPPLSIVYSIPVTQRILRSVELNASRG